MQMTSVSRIRNLQHGFTFMELIIAIAILAILAVTVGPGVLRYIGGAKQSQTENNIVALKQAVDSFYLKTGRYPNSLQDLIVKPADLTPTKWSGPYLEKSEKIPTDGWDNEYVYKLTPKGAHPYELYSYGANGPEGTAEEMISAWK